MSSAIPPSVDDSCIVKLLSPSGASVSLCAPVRTGAYPGGGSTIVYPSLGRSASSSLSDMYRTRAGLNGTFVATESEAAAGGAAVLVDEDVDADENSPAGV